MCGADAGTPDRAPSNQLGSVGPRAVSMMEQALGDIARRIGECAIVWTQTFVGSAELGAIERVIVYVKQDRDARDGRLVDKRGQALAREVRPGVESNMRPDGNSLRCAGRGQPRPCWIRGTKAPAGGRGGRRRGRDGE